MTDLTPNMRGALLMMLSMTAFTVNDTLMKATSDAVPFYQGIFLRGVLITVGLLVFGAMTGRLRFRLASLDWWLIAGRSLAEVVGTYFFLTALYQMPIANLSAILQSLPLTVTLAAAVLFGEPVGWRRLVAIAIGLGGVLLIVQPGGDGFSVYAIYGVAAVVAVTFRDLAARRLSASVPSLTVAIMAAIFVTLFAAVAGMHEPWAALDTRSGSQIGAAALSLMIGYVSAVTAMRSGDIGFVAPFRYTGLIVAMILGFLVFGEWPVPLTLLGAGIVVATGLFTFYRERNLARKAALGLRIR